jgi:hypothetical protein
MTSSTSQALGDLYQLLRELHGADRDWSVNRKLVCTPFEAGYRPHPHAGWIVAVQGTPARGTLFIEDAALNQLTPPVCTYVSAYHQKVKRLTGSVQIGIVRRFWECYLAGATERITIDPNTEA